MLNLAIKSTWAFIVISSFYLLLELFLLSPVLTAMAVLLITVPLLFVLHDAKEYRKKYGE